ncbi:MAG: hypothetical protein ABSF82_03850 [Candidatus Bathyarchaeia archaeon]|jgi:hypothetical protein
MRVSSYYYPTTTYAKRVAIVTHKVMCQKYAPLAGISYERKLIPAPITRALKIEDGDTLVIGLNDHQITMSKKGGKG